MRTKRLNTLSNARAGEGKGIPRAAGDAKLSPELLAKLLRKSHGIYVYNDAYDGQAIDGGQVFTGDSTVRLDGEFNAEELRAISDNLEAYC